MPPLVRNIPKTVAADDRTRMDNHSLPQQRVVFNHDIGVDLRLIANLRLFFNYAPGWITTRSPMVTFCR